MQMVVLNLMSMTKYALQQATIWPYCSVHVLHRVPPALYANIHLHHRSMQTLLFYTKEDMLYFHVERLQN